MKQEYTDKMKYYQGKEYENFLREKCVLDARQFLYSSQLYLNYAIITAKLYEDIGKKNQVIAKLAMLVRKLESKQKQN